MLNHSPALDGVFSALSDPSRRAMVERLGRGPASVSELAAPLDMSLAAVVQHIQVLADSGVIRTRKVGRVRSCQLRPEALKRAGGWIVARQEAFWKAGLREIGRIVDDDDQTKSKKGKKR
jgi:DNA-binding transcriptional ArsR family regulator